MLLYNNCNKEGVIMKKIIVLLCIVSLSLTSLLNTELVKAEDTGTHGSTTAWDCIWFGSYPQKSITHNASVFSKLNNLSIYKWENGIPTTTLNNKKYTMISDSDYFTRDLDYVYDNKIYNPDYCDFVEKIHNIFPFEITPVKWRVLNVKDNIATVMSEELLDASHYFLGQKYDGYYFFYNGDEHVTWNTSLVRNYMNEHMYNILFTEGDKKSILATENEFTNYNHITETEEKETVTDNIFLPSMNDLQNKDYGFSEDSSLDCSRKANASDYARAMMQKNYGATNIYKDYYLRTDGEVWPKSHFDISFVPSVDIQTTDGYLKPKGGSGLKLTGIRAMMKIDLSKANYKDAGKVFSDGTVEEIPYEDPVKPVTKPGKVKIKKVTKAKKSSKCTVKLKKIKSAKGYQIAVYKKYKKAKKNKGAVIKKTYSKYKSKYVLKSKKIKKSKKVYVRARAYKLDNKKKIYGKWSNIKKSKA